MNDSSLANTISSLARRVDAAAATAGQRRWITAAILGCLLLAAAGYLRYLYRTITEFAEPNVLVELAASQIEPQLGSELDRVDVLLKNEAPGLMSQAEKMILDAPPQLAEEANRYLASQFDGHLSKLESQAYDLISGMLQEAIARSKDKGIDLNDKRQIDALVDESMPLVRKELRKVIAQLYAEYAASADGIGTFINRLTSATDLTPLEKHQREVLISGLALIKKIEADPSRAPLQGLIEGRSPAAP